MSTSPPPSADLITTRAAQRGSAAGTGGRANGASSEKGGPVLERREAEMARQGLADIGKAGAPAERTRCDFRPEGEDRDMLARVVAAAPGRITTVIGGDDGDVAGAQRGDEGRQHGIERFERGGIAGDIAAVAEQGVEIVEIGKGEGAL